MFRRHRQPQQPEPIRFLDDQPKPYVAPVSAPAPPAPAKGEDKAKAANAASPPSKRGGLALVGLFAATTFAGGAYLKENGFPIFDNGVKVETSMPPQTFAVKETPTVTLDSFQGRVEVVRGAADSVEVVAVKHARGKDQGSAQAELNQVTVSATGDDKSVTVSATRGAAPKMGDSWVDFEVKAPAKATVKVKTSNGEVEIRQMVGSVEVRSSNGRIEIQDGGGSLNLNTTNGSISIDAEEAVVKADTSNGRIRFDGSLGDGESLLQTQNGRVDVELPNNQSFRVDAKTSNGKISSEFKVKSDEPIGKNSGKLVGTVGANPKSELKIRTSNGRIEIEKD